MSTNATELTSSSDVLNGTNSTDNYSLDVLALFKHLDFLMLELKLIGGAMSIIYLGAHASLRRPPSASPSKNKKTGKARKEDESFAQGLELSDAILFPLMAAFVLIGLYYLIQWLKDPVILSKILRYYMSTVSVAGMVTLYAHGMELAISFVFPRWWRGRDGLLRMVEQKNHSVVVCDNAGNAASGTSLGPSNPFPAFLSILAPTRRLQAAAWKCRELLTRRWIFKFFLYGVGKEKASLKFTTLLAVPVAASTAILYFSTNTPLLSNLLGYGMCYCSFLILSPTDLQTGSLVLIGLFFYDILMVFYTPYMITVATTLDVPIKLQFKSGERKSILGLGDIVIPGMFIAWALRLDLWLHYQRKTKYELTDMKILEKDTTTGEVKMISDTKHKEVKAPYTDVQGTWGDFLWVRGSLFLTRPRQIPLQLDAARFPRPYFHATMLGYLAGMAVTLCMLLIFKRGQPALLYLVPGVLISIYATGLARGEFKTIWSYTEDGSLDTVDVVVELDDKGKEVRRIGKLENGVVDTTKPDDTDKAKDKGESASNDKKESRKDAEGHDVFYISLETPPAEEDEDDE